MQDIFVYALERNTMHRLLTEVDLITLETVIHLRLISAVNYQ